jgi:hypothetical protein
MRFLDTVAAFFRRTPDETAGEVPDGACPNCWGHFEYDGQFRKAAKDRGYAVLAGQEKQAFIQAFVSEHIDGIRLQRSAGGLVCPHCKVEQPSSKA